MLNTTVATTAGTVTVTTTRVDPAEWDGALYVTFLSLEGSTAFAWDGYMTFSVAREQHRIIASEPAWLAATVTDEQ